MTWIILAWPASIVFVGVGCYMAGGRDEVRRALADLKNDRDGGSHR